MSSTLYWKPIRPRKGKSLSTSLKWIFQKNYGSPVNAVLTEEDLPYLQGLADAQIEDAQKLIDAIEKYGRISLEESWQ